MPMHMGVATSSPPKHTFADFSREKGQPAMYSGFVRTSPPLNETSFFIDSDADEEDASASDTGESLDYETDPSPIASSVESLSERTSGNTTSPADVVTPSSKTDENAPGLIFRLKSVKGHEDREGHHLFRATLASTQDFDWQTYQPDIEPYYEPPPVPAIPAQFKPQPKDEIVPEVDDSDDVVSDLHGTTVDDQPRDERSDVEKWTTQQVAAWMYNSGFENSIISTFRIHDINGAILLDLSFEDLRELDVPSYGKRKQIWNEIIALRTEGCRDPLQAPSYSRDRGCNHLINLHSPADRTRRAGLERSRTSVTGYRHPMRPVVDQPQYPSYQPPEIPRPHRCSKGEKCPKWKQQQTVIAEIDRDHGPDTPRSGMFHFSSPLASRRASLATTLSTVVHAPISNDSSASAEAWRLQEKLPPVPPIPAAAAESPALKPMSQDSAIPPSASPVPQHVYDTRHIVQQYTKSNTSINNSTPDTPTWSLFPAPSAPSEPQSPPHPPRFSSLPGTLPKLNIPLSPLQGPNSSETTICGPEAQLPLTSDVPMPSQPFSHMHSPELVPAPLSPFNASRDRSPSPNINAIVTQMALASASNPKDSNTNNAKRTSRQQSPYQLTDPSHQLRSPSSEPAMPSALPGDLFRPGTAVTHATAPTLARRPTLRAAQSTDAIPLRRQAKPLPTLLESSLASHKSPKYSSKPLPETPYLFPSPERKKTAPTVPAVNRDAVRSPPPSSRNLTFAQRSRSNSDLAAEHPALDRKRASKAAIKMPPMPASAPIQFSPPRGPRMSQAPPPRTPTPSTTYTIVPSTPRVSSPPLSPDAYGPDILLVGYVRQRRARLWRHEWVPVHLRLTKTQMSVHASARPEDKPLEVIKMDEYEVAVSHEAGGSRIQSTIQRLRGGSSGSNVSIDDTFTFQLVPTTEMMESHSQRARSGSMSSKSGSEGSGSDKVPSDGSDSSKSGSVGSKDEMSRGFLKSYYFAVKTRDDRIEWMRQLMMARETIAKTERMKRQQASLEASPEHSRSVTARGSQESFETAHPMK